MNRIAHTVTLSCMCLYLFTAIGTSCAAGDANGLSLRGLGMSADAVLTSVSHFSGISHELDVDLLVAGRSSTVLNLELVNASPASQRQALAQAMGLWWANKPDGSVVFLSSRQVPHGPMMVDSLTSDGVRNPAYEALMRHLLQPWMGRDSGISLLSDVALWTATLDAAGQSRFHEIIEVIESGIPRCASDLGDCDQPDLEVSLTTAVHASTWGGLVGSLASATACSVSLDYRVAARAFPADGVYYEICQRGELPANLAKLGLSARFLHGVLCLGDAQSGMPAEGEHPAQRRLLAMLPISQLIHGASDGDFIATALKRLTGQDEQWWSQPGADLIYCASCKSLLVAADRSTQMDVINAVDAIDRLGLDDGLKVLEK